MVLKTVNQDDPSNYHLFYANGRGEPGSGITFFPWPMAVKGRAGTGQTTRIGFGVPARSRDFWINRFENLDVPHNKPSKLFGYDIVEFYDPDGLTLQLVFDDDIEDVEGWSGGNIPEEHSIRGFWSAVLRLEETGPTAEIIEQILGFKRMDTEGNFTLFKSNSSIGRHLIMEETGSYQPTKNGRGIVHHIAFRAKNEEELHHMREQTKHMGLSPTDVIDRHVFKSVYFQAPGGVLFEMATDGPGYKSLVDDENKMGEELFLPPWLEPDRDQIEKRLPEIKV